MKFKPPNGRKLGMYYFTFGSGGRPPMLFNGGWVRINADNIHDAQKKFIDHYGDRALRPGSNCVLNYAFDYTEEEFEKTGMGITGNRGQLEHEYID